MMQQAFIQACDDNGKNVNVERIDIAFQLCSV